MEDLDIEKVIIDNFNKMVKDENYTEEQIKEHINKIQEGLNQINQNGDLEVLKILYLIQQNNYEKLSLTGQKILVKDNKGMFNNITTGIIFALGYKKSCYKIQTQNKSEKDKNITLVVPEKFNDNVLSILNSNCKNWKSIFNVEIS